MTKRFSLLLSVLALSPLALPLGCVAELGNGDGVGLAQQEVEQRSSIINGNLPFATHHEAVVSLHNRFGSSLSRFSFCTGTLISPTVVLTAAHCMEGNSASDLAIYVGDNPRTDSNAEFHGVSEVFVHPNYDSFRTVNDLALLRLQTTVTSVTPVPPLPASLGFTNADSGSLLLEFVGFGVTESGSSDQKLVATATFAGTGCVVNGCGFGMTSAEARNAMISYSQFSEGPCNGDSGGPAFVVRDGTVYVGGMTSFGDQQCNQYGVSARADSYESLIRSFAPDIIDPVTEPEPQPEPQPDPTPAPQPEPQPEPTPGENILENGDAFLLNGATGSTVTFRGTLEEGTQNFLIAMSEGTGDADLYVRFGTEPTAQVYDCRPFLEGNREQCAFANPPAGDFFVQVRGYSAFSDAVVEASWTQPVAPPPGPEPFFSLDEDLSATRNRFIAFTFDIPAGDAPIRFVQFGGSGDADLYVKKGSGLSTQNYDCRPFRDGNDEECVFDDAAGGTYEVWVRAYTTFRGVSLQVSRE